MLLFRTTVAHSMCCQQALCVCPQKVQLPQQTGLFCHEQLQLSIGLGTLPCMNRPMHLHRRGISLEIPELAKLTARSPDPTINLCFPVPKEQRTLRCWLWATNFNFHPTLDNWPMFGRFLVVETSNHLGFENDIGHLVYPSFRYWQAHDDRYDIKLFLNSYVCVCHIISMQVYISYAREN